MGKRHVRSTRKIGPKISRNGAKENHGGYQNNAQEVIPAAQTYGKKTQAKKFYESIRWDHWWDEFTTQVRQDGQPKYPTAWSLIRAKLKNPVEQKIAYWVIGPKPAFDKDVKKSGPPVPWLGDWTSKRANLTMYSSEKLQSLQQVIKERLDGLEAGKGIANLTLDDIARFHKLASEIDKWFGGLEGILPEQGDTSALTEKQRYKIMHEMERRFNLYAAMQEQVMAAKMRASKMYLKCHGVSDDDVTALAAMAMSGMVAGAAVANGKRQIQNSSMPDVRTLLADNMMKKAQLLGTKLPDAQVQEVIDLHVDKALKEKD